MVTFSKHVSKRSSPVSVNCVINIETGRNNLHSRLDHSRPDPPLVQRKCLLGLATLRTTSLAHIKLALVFLFKLLRITIAFLNFEIVETCSIYEKYRLLMNEFYLGIPIN